MEDVAGPGLSHIAAPDRTPLLPVLVIHSWWGLTESFATYANRLASRGFLVGCSDLYSGEIARNEDDVRRLRGRRREPTYVRLRRDLEELRALGGVEDAPPAVIGFSAGGHWAVWLAQHPDPPVSAVVLYYAARAGDFSRATAPILAHYAESDDFVSPSARRRMERAVNDRGLLYRAHEYTGTEHWFAEATEAAFDASAAALALERTTEFLTDLSR